ncbi:MAG: thioredoxin family protein [Odoribacteraceae bacterium]|jgi:thiol-disulfide isomerase/thioredoxin|nr:thioredoxin family protein [Odoribacteraceae bacterium]
MKKRLLILMAALAAAIPALSQGIAFEQELTFRQALDKAAASGKLLFVDCYTAWCGPCKLLAEQVFPREEVGAFFNERFVSLQIDMEKGEGPALAERYAVKAYPTLLVIRPDGQVQHRIVGFRDAAALIESAREGCSDERSLAALEAGHDNGNRDAATVTRYALALLDAGDLEKATRVVDDFYASLADEAKTDPALWPLHANAALSPWGSSRLEFLRLHKPAFDRLAGKAAVDSLLYTVTTDLFMTLLFKNRDGLTLAYLPEFIETLRGMEFERQASVLAEAEFTLALTRQEAGETVRLYRERGKEFSNKGIMNLVPLMLQNKGQFNAGTHPASIQLVELIESERK